MPRAADVSAVLESGDLRSRLGGVGRPSPNRDRTRIAPSPNRGGIVQPGMSIPDQRRSRASPPLVRSLDGAIPPILVPPAMSPLRGSMMMRNPA